ncbi:MAG: translocation/assembly module TamB domain-containing protein [Phaeovulum sp.]|uniref:translocation/assembly module TamB domain-containing protein n=1 Tax=Phaeovulum sp. TaxID=2934796 RepID=UPI002731EAD3|nr:translocation/assembly module TamB domain-containing protein [Phaeovulum sp.]MDP2062150.1 translocation/assembly module TamB domain-containing protein [Phaeovulum sp.]
MRRLLFPLALALLALAAPIAAQTEAERDRGLIQRLLEDNLSGAGREVRIEGFAGALSSRATFSEMTIADDEGIWLRISGGAISWNRAALVSGRIEIGELAAKEIVLARLPQTTSQTAVPEAVPFALPELPVSVTIGTIAAERVELAASVLGMPAVLRLQGTLNLAGGEGSARLNAERIDGQAGSFALRASFVNATRELMLDLLLDEAAGGIAAAALGLPDRPALTLAIAGSGPLETFSADVVLSADRARRLAGRVGMTAPDAETRGFTARLGGDIAPLLPPDYRGFFGPDVQLRAEGQRSADGGLRLTLLSLQSAALALDGTLDLQASGLPARAALVLTLGLPDEAEVLLPSAGEKTWVAGGMLTLGYDREKSETWSAAGRLNGLRRAAGQVATLDLTGSGRVAQGTAAEITGAFNFAASGIATADPALALVLAEGLRGQVQFSWRQGTGLMLPVLSLNAGGAVLSGSAEVTGAGLETRLGGSARVSHPDLARFSDLAGRRLGGRIEGVVEGWYMPLDGSLFLETALLGIDLRTGPAELDRLLAGGSRLRVVAERDAGGMTLALGVDARGFSAQAEALLQSHETRATAHFAMPDLGMIGRGWQGALNADARLSGAPGARVMTVEGVGSGLGIGDATTDRLLAGDSVLAFTVLEGDAGFALGAVELANPQFAAELGATDTSGARGLSARLADMALFAPAFPGAATVSGQVQRVADGYALILTAEGPGGSAATISGPVAADLASVDLAISGRAEAALLNRLVAPRSLQGPLGFDLHLRGTPSLNALSGRVSARGLRFADPGPGLAVQDIALTADLVAGRAEIEASGAIGGGVLRASGPVALRPPFLAEIALVLQGVPLRDPELYDTRLDGNLSVSGALAGGALISGALSLAQTELRLPEAAALVALPDVTHLGAPAEVNTTRRRAGLLGGSGARGGDAVFQLDIAVAAPRRIFVRGRGLDAELGGALRMGGTSAEVQTSGQFDLIRGRLDILGRRFTLTEGQVQLQGALSPWIRFSATTAAAGITATITLEGEATAPVLRLSSTSDLPQDEVLARLLFSRGIDTLSPLQAVQMAQAVAQLAGKGGEGLMGRLRQSFGLDDLDLATDAEGGAALRLGKYLSDNLYTDVTLGSDGKAEVNLNLDLTPSLTARGTLGADGSSGLGLYFERDY